MTMRSTAIRLRLSNLDPAIDTDLEEVAIEGAEDEAAQVEDQKTGALGEVRTEALGEEVRTGALREEARTGAQEEDQDQATDQEEEDQDQATVTDQEEEDQATVTDQEEEDLATDTDQVTITTTCWPQSPWELDRPNS